MNSEWLWEHAQGLYTCELGHFPLQRGVVNQPFSSVTPQNKNRTNLVSWSMKNDEYSYLGG